MIKTGIGYDVHRLKIDKPFYIGGVKINSNFGSEGHSDGDALSHAIVDAILGAAGLGDIGEYFPSDDDSWKDISSSIFLKEAIEKINNIGYIICNVDTTIVLKKPRLEKYKNKIKNNLALIMGLDEDNINIKATTTDGLGQVGDGKGWAAIAIVTIQKKVL